MNRCSVGLVVVIQLCLSGCLDGPRMFQQDGSAADDYTMLTTADNGVTSGQFDPSNSGMQVLNAAGGTSISGASAQFPPGALAVDVMISLQEGSAIANAALAAELSISGNLDAAGSAVVVSNSLAIDANKDFTMSVPRNQGGNLALAASDERLIVVYRVLKNGETFAGVIPNSALTISGDSITFKSRYFGSYQAALSNVAITKPVETASETPILTKNDEVRLEPLVLKVGNYSAHAVAREITWPLRVEGAERLVRCTAFVHASKAEAPILRQSTDDGDELARMAGSGDVYQHRLRTDRAVTRHYRFACTDVTGRSVMTPFYTARIDAKPSNSGSSVDVHFKHWLAAGTAYTSRLWDTNGGPVTRAVAGGCDPGAGPVHVRVGGHELGEAVTSLAGSFPCLSNGTFSFDLDIDISQGTGHLDLPNRLGGALVEASQGTDYAEAVIIKYNSGSQTIVPINNRSGLAGIPDNSTAGTIYVLTADIEMGGCGTPWASAPINFGSILVGDLFHIKDLCIVLTANAYTNVGLFADIHMGIVSHLGFDSPIIQGTPDDAENVGILAGKMYGSAIPAIINHVWVTNADLDLSSNSANVSTANDNVGGIVGVGNMHGSLSEVMFDGVINAPANRNVGGIVGNAEYLAVYDAFVGGPSPSTITGKVYVGGIAGALNNGSAPTFPHGFLVRGDVVNTTVEATGESGIAAAGGLVGVNLQGDINEARSHVGIGHLTSGLKYSGGAVGKNYGTLQNLSVISTIEAVNAIVGGMVGWEAGGGGSLIASSYAITDFEVTSSGSGYCGGLIGKLSSADAGIISDVWVIPELVSGTSCNSATDALAGAAASNISTTPPSRFYWYSATFDVPSNHDAISPSSLGIAEESAASDLFNPNHTIYSANWDFTQIWRWEASGPPQLQWGGP